MAQPITITMRLDGKTQVLQGLAQVSAGIRGAFAQVAGPLAAVAGIGAITEAIRRAVTVGVSFNATLETARLGIAAVQRQLNPDRFRTFEDAMAAADSTLARLKQKAVESPASFQELVQGFQAITGAASQANIPLDKQVDMTVLMSQALAGLGIQNEQLLQETRALITGNIDRNALAAKLLNITGAEIRQAREQGQLYEFLTGRLSAFAEAGKRSTQTFTVMWSNIKDAFQQAAGVAFEPVFDEIKGLFRRTLDEVQFDGIAQKIRAGLQLGFESFRDGTYVELIGLVIEAGFEAGATAAKNVLAGVFGSEAFGNAFVAMLGGAIKVGADMFLGFTKTVAEAVFTLAALLAKSLVGAFNFVFSGATKLVNDYIGHVNTLFGTDLKPLGGLVFTFDAAGFQRGVDAMDVAAGRASDKFGAFVDAGVNAYRAVGAMGPGTGTAGSRLGGFLEQVDARAKLNAENERRAKLERQFQADTNALLVKTAGAQKVVVDWTEKERDLRRQLTVAKAEEARIQGDFTKTAAEKFAATTKALAKEKQLLIEVVALLELRRAEAERQKDDNLVQTLSGRIDTATGQIEGVQTRQENRGPDPNSFGQNFEAQWTELRGKTEAWAADLSTALLSPIQGFRDGLANALDEILTKGGNAAQFFQGLAESVRTSMIRAFSDMVANWITSHIVMKGVAIAYEGVLKALRWAGVIDANASEAAKTPALAANATLASVSSWGVAVAVGVAAIAGILASVGAFADGGRPPVGQMSLVGERGPELFIPDSAGTIIPADATASLLKQDSGFRGGSGRAGGGGSTSSTVNLATFDTREDARRWADSQDAEVWFADMARKTAHRWRGGGA